ncbi:cold-shock DNA-binding domain-containing protein [Pseudomonas syringae pv. actinidiae ICMP 19096]|uniref:Cold-shock DNA-binding domain-containing protein n=1 Tax=Pseudomonas syringae pv. actinidiae ICMP 19096 TaxID=1194405 RepID=A0A656K5I6_PSESF|nr:cold-shock DNA-binding domain-containing protein [Pseudomonas syringae pv. actinidiae ICMP 19096]
MLKIVHLVTGAAALLLSFIPSLRSEAVSPYLQNPDALCLAFLGLLNLILAPVIPYWNRGPRHNLQNLVSALLVIAVVAQTLTLLVPLQTIAGQPAVMVSLTIAIVAVALHLGVSFYRSYSPSPATQSHDMGNRDTGTVKWFNTSKGFGFISRDSGDDIFVHFRAIRGEGHRVLVEGQRVEFSVMNRDKGLQAEDVIAALPRTSHRMSRFFMQTDQ